MGISNTKEAKNSFQNHPKNEDFQSLKIEVTQGKEKIATENLYLNKHFQLALEKGKFKKGVTLHYINEDIFSIFNNENNDINSFSNLQGDILLFVKDRTQKFIDENKEYLEISTNSFEKAGYFVNTKKGDRNIYKIIGKDEKGEFILSNMPLDKNSIDYFNAFKEIIKYYDTDEVKTAIKHKWKFGEGNIDNYINSEVLNLKLLQLLKNKNLFENPDTFEYAIKNMDLTIQDIVTAKNKGDITEEEGREIYNILQK